MKKYDFRMLGLSATLILTVTAGLGWTLVESRSVETMKDFNAYLGDRTNGLLRERTIGGVNYRLALQPADLLAYREFCAVGALQPESLDSLMQSFSQTLAFQMNLSPDKSVAEGDVMYKGISSYDDYADRVRMVNFNMPEMIALHIGENVYTPVLCLAENTYSLTQGRNVLILFEATDLQSAMIANEESTVVFNDEIFGSGIQHFRFENDKLMNIPGLPIDDALVHAGVN